MQFNVEWIGLLASCFVLASFLASGERKIRTINIFGASLFVVYGLMLGAISVWVLNGILLLTHIRRLMKLSKES